MPMPYEAKQDGSRRRTEVRLQAESQVGNSYYVVRIRTAAAELPIEQQRANCNTMLECLMIDEALFFWR